MISRVNEEEWELIVMGTIELRLKLVYENHFYNRRQDQSPSGSKCYHASTIL